MFLNPYRFSAAGSDPYWSSVTSLLHFDGANGSTVFTDVTGKTWTASGNAQIDTSQSQFGGASGLFDGIGDYLQSASVSGFEADTDFTLEAWVRPNDSGRLMAIVQKRPTGTGNEAGYLFYVSASNTLGVIAWNTTAAVLVNLVGSNTVAFGAFSHVAFTKQSATWRIFLGGNLEASGSESGVYRTSSQSILVGRDSTNSARDWKGHIDDFRVTKGVARYTSSFSPPTAAFPNS